MTADLHRFNECYANRIRTLNTRAAIMSRVPLILLSLSVLSCGGGTTSGYSNGVIFITNMNCSNLETNQTLRVDSDSVCPPGWVPGSIFNCRNIDTDKIELILVNGADQCPEGYSGGEVHEFCGSSSSDADFQICL